MSLFAPFLLTSLYKAAYHSCVGSRLGVLSTLLRKPYDFVAFMLSACLLTSFLCSSNQMQGGFGAFASEACACLAMELVTWAWPAVHSPALVVAESMSANYVRSVDATVWMPLDGRQDSLPSYMETAEGTREGGRPDGPESSRVGAMCIGFGLVQHIDRVVSSAVVLRV